MTTIQELLETLELAAQRKNYRVKDYFTPYAKQIEFCDFGSYKRERLLMAGNQCLSPWTWVSTPEGERLAGDIFCEEDARVVGWDGTAECTARVTGGILLGIEPAFRVVLDTGEFFDCTSRHRVATEHGWLSLARLVLLSSGWRSWHKVEDYQASCVAGGYLRDLQLPSAARIFSGKAPSPDDVQVHSLTFSHVDATARIPERIRYDGRACVPLSIFGDAEFRPADLFDRFSDASVYSRVLPLTGNSQVLGRLHAVSELQLLSTDEAGLRVQLLALHTTPKLTGGRRIVAIAPLGYQPIVDATVPVVNAYKAAGVYHHNTGKTEIGAYELACHLTGEYPDWWLGKTWDRPVKWWAGGITGLTTRDVVQKKLCGEPGVESKFGTGMIPKDAFVGKPSLARGISDLFDKIVVKHKSGGDSVVILKTYEQGREKWQGDTLDGVWFDEEPPADIYNEGLTRLAEGGIAYMTFTPLLGMSEVVMSFIETAPDGTPECKHEDKGLVTMTIDDVGHFSVEEKKKRVAGYKDYEREARARGIPVLGSGRIFQVTEEMISEDAIPIERIPAHWTLLWGLDFGIDHPFAAALIAWDKDADVIHVVATVRMRNAMIVQHAAAMKPFGWIKVAWPQDGHQRDAGDLEPMSKMYKKAGLRMLDHHATFPDGSNSTEAGITEMDERMKTGRFKVARHLQDWFEEFRLYHRKDGLIVKVRDDLMSATRVAVMAKRFSSTRMQEPKPGAWGEQKMAIGHDDPPW